MSKYNLYNNKQWRAIRSEQLHNEPLCRRCKAIGIYTPATVCDHIDPHKGDVEAFWRGPFQSLCQVCHSLDKQRIEKNLEIKPVIGLDGWPMGGGAGKVNLVSPENQPPTFHSKQTRNTTQ